VVIVTEWSKKMGFRCEGAWPEIFYSTVHWPKFLVVKMDLTVGLGGSMHAFFPPFGILPNNAIVGGSADIAMGAALLKSKPENGIVISNIGEMHRWDVVQLGKR